MELEMRDEGKKNWRNFFCGGSLLLALLLFCAFLLRVAGVWKMVLWWDALRILTMEAGPTFYFLVF